MDISAFRSIADYEEGSNDCTMQINSFLKNGVNNVTIKMYPLFKKEKLLRAAVEILFLHNPKRDISKNFNDKTISSYGKLVSFVDKDGRDIIQYFYEDDQVKRLSLMNFRIHRKKVGNKLEVIF